MLGWPTGATRLALDATLLLPETPVVDRLDSCLPGLRRVTRQVRRPAVVNLGQVRTIWSGVVQELPENVHGDPAVIDIRDPCGPRVAGQAVARGQVREVVVCLAGRVQP